MRARDRRCDFRSSTSSSIQYACKSCILRIVLLQKLPFRTLAPISEATRGTQAISRANSVLRTSSVEDVEQTSLIINGHLLTVGVFNGRIVLIDEVVLDELDRKGRLADTTTA